MDKQIKVAVAAILIKNNQILLNQRGKDEGNEKWDLPAGHLEFGENIEECILREVKEETCLDVEITRLVSIAENKKYGNHYIVFTFEVHQINETQIIEHNEPEIHKKWWWFDVNNLPEKQFVTLQNAMRDYRKGVVYEYQSISTNT